MDVALFVKEIRSAPLEAFTAVICYDTEMLMSAGAPRFSDDLLDRTGTVAAFPLGEAGTPQRQGGGKGFLIWGTVRDLNRSGAVLAGDAIVLCTLFFRVLAGPGTATAVEVCDGTFASILDGSDCLHSALIYSSPSGGAGFLEVRSSTHSPGTITILPGDPVHVDLPALPPLARIYPEAPSSEEAGVVFELEPRGPIDPVTRRASVDLFISGGYEWTGFTASITYTPQLVSISGVDWPSRRGAETVFAEEGHLVLALLDSVRRFGEEGERVHAATIGLEVAAGADPAEPIELRLEDVLRDGAGWSNVVTVRTQGGLALPSAQAEIAPARLEPARLLAAGGGTRRGDANRDGRLDVSDPIAVLLHLFQGGTLECAAAADFDEDGAIRISDPIALLGYLFRSAPTPSGGEVECE